MRSASASAASASSVRPWARSAFARSNALGVAASEVETRLEVADLRVAREGRFSETESLRPGLVHALGREERLRAQEPQVRLVREALRRFVEYRDRRLRLSALGEELDEREVGRRRIRARDEVSKLAFRVLLVTQPRVELGGERVEIDGRFLRGERLFQEPERLFRPPLFREHLGECPPGEGVVGARAHHLPKRRDRRLGLALLRLNLREGHVEPAPHLVPLLALASECGASFLDGPARLLGALLREERRDPHEPRLGALGVEALGLGERLERALEVAEVELRLGAGQERLRVLCRTRSNRSHGLACEARVAEQERCAREGEPHVVALGEAPHRLLEEPPGPGCIARLDEVLGYLE